jgi:alpha-beta hydrolase superfamily lysophospholipase
MKNKTLFASFLILTACSSSSVRGPSSVVSNTMSESYSMVSYPFEGNEKIRIAAFNEIGKKKGCVLYLQGLADSIKNHKPFFTKLTSHGYKVLAFDYRGQGGSEGTMNDTRVSVSKPADKNKSISAMADFVWNRFPECKTSKKNVIGWSTGGLAGYVMAHEKKADNVILLAPGIAPKLMIGESEKRWDKMLCFRQTITERTLTRNAYLNEENPHVEVITPKSPMHVPLFAANLVKTGSNSRNWKIDSSVKGIVLLSGQEDSYVDREKTLSVIRKNAPHFAVKMYNGALHELDNEIPNVSMDVHESAIRFLDQVN